MKTDHKKLTILVESEIYHVLQRQVGRGNIGRFLVDAARPTLAQSASLRKEYQAMAIDEAREREARTWNESLIDDAYVA